MECKRIFKNRNVILLYVLVLVIAVGIYIYQQVNSILAERAMFEREKEIAEEDGLLPYEVTQAQYAASYQEYLENMLVQNDDLASISIFQKTDSYSYRNLQKTKADFNGLVEVKAEEGNFRALETVVGFEIADYVIFLCGVMIVWAFFDDEKKGLWCVNYATPGGRIKLAMRRSGVLIVGNCIFTMVLYFLLFASAFMLYGGMGDIGCSVQSSPMFQNCTLQVSVLGYIFLFVLLYVAMASAISLFVWMVLLWCRNHLLSMALLIVILAGEGILSNVLPEQSVLAVLKYENLFRLIHPGDILYVYRNYNLFSYPINCFHAFLYLVFVTVVVGAGMSLWITSHRRPVASAGKAETIIAGWLKKLQEVYHGVLSHLSVLGMELYKVLVMQKGVLFLIVWIYLLVSQIDTSSVFYLGTGVVLKDIYSEYSGPDDGRLKVYIKEQEDVLLQAKTQYEETVAAYEAGSISREELENASLYYSSFSTLESSIDSVNAQLSYMERVREERDIDAWFLSDKGYRILWNRDGLYSGQGYGNQERRGLLAVIVLILLLSTVFSYDRTCGMEKMLRATPYGREKLFFTKIRLAFLCCFFICVVTYGLELYEVQQLYPVSCFGAPVQSIEFMERFPIVMSIGTFLLLVELIHLIVLFAIAMVVYVCSACLKGPRGMIVALIVLVFPAALQMLGFDWCQYISAVQPLVYVEALQEHGFVYSVSSVFVMLIIGAICYQLVKKRWCRN